MRVISLCTLFCLLSSAGFAAESQTGKEYGSAIAAAAEWNPESVQVVAKTQPRKNTGAKADPQQTDANTAYAISREEICNTMASAAQDHELPVAFFTSLIWHESRFRPQAVSPVGAQGVAQFMPRVADAMGLDDPFNPFEALPMAARLLRNLFDQFGNLGLAAAAYNAGPTRVSNWLGKRGKLPKETRDYVMNITGRPAESWRNAKPGSTEFKVPERAQCGVVASRPETTAKGVRFREIADIPLPPRRPDSVEPATAVATSDAQHEAALRPTEPERQVVEPRVTARQGTEHPVTARRVQVAGVRQVPVRVATQQVSKAVKKVAAKAAKPLPTIPAPGTKVLAAAKTRGGTAAQPTRVASAKAKPVSSKPASLSILAKAGKSKSLKGNVKLASARN